jgi:hypothetical protein
MEESFSGACRSYEIESLLGEAIQRHAIVFGGRSPFLVITYLLPDKEGGIIRPIRNQKIASMTAR